MANIEFVEGIVCKKCGNLIVKPTIFTRELCQCCGEKLIDINMRRKTYSLLNNAQSVKVKITHKFFRDDYDVVGEL